MNEITGSSPVMTKENDETLSVIALPVMTADDGAGLCPTTAAKRKTAGLLAPPSSLAWSAV